MKKLRNLPALIVFALAALHLIGCSGSAETGTLVVRLSDAPFPITHVDEVNVDVDKIEARNKSSEGNPFVTLSTELQTYNLLDLQNGVTVVLAESEVPPGEYDLVRLYVSGARITLNDQEEDPFDLTVPSGAQTGIKVFLDPPLTVAEAVTSELLLDFDVSQSFVVQGNPETPAGIEGFHFKPVVRGADLSIAGQVTGVVTDIDTGDPIQGAEVMIDLDPDLDATAITDVNGEYTLLGIPEGTHTVTASKEDSEGSYEYEPESKTDEVIAGSTTVVDFALTKVPE
jgi:hypothetical protein